MDSPSAEKDGARGRGSVAAFLWFIRWIFPPFLLPLFALLVMDWLTK